MTREEIVASLRDLSDKDFVELVYEAANDRHIYELERESIKSHLVLANAVSEKEDDGTWSAWQLQLICPTPTQPWVSDAPICQFGEHCGHETASWSKHATCPICGDEVYGT